MTLYPQMRSAFWHAKLAGFLEWQGYKDYKVATGVIAPPKIKIKLYEKQKS